MEKICNCLIILASEDKVGQFLVMFSVSEYSLYPFLLRIKVAKTNFQREKKKVLPIYKVGVVFTHHRAPLICHLCQLIGPVP